jgi:hypothetical protein
MSLEDDKLSEILSSKEFKDVLISTVTAELDYYSFRLNKFKEMSGILNTTVNILMDDFLSKSVLFSLINRSNNE